MNEEAQTLDEALDRLWRYALDVRREIDRTPPDLVVGLAHSAQLAVHAAQGLWRCTRPQPFPPTLITNLGREKKARYDAYRQARTLDSYHGDLDGSEDVGFFLAWLAEQQDWQAQLRDQVAAVLGVAAAPKHILVLDERSAAAGTDGIQYLAQMIAHGIQTPLTEPYRQAILRLTGAADLAAARTLVAAQRGITAAHS